MSSEQKIESGLKMLLELDGHLLKIDVNERAITHRLGMYYQELFDKWDVDCEYNRRLDQPKDVQFDIEQLLGRMLELLVSYQNSEANELLSFFHRGSIKFEELSNLREQLREPDIRYDSEHNFYYFVLRLLNGETINKLVVPDIIVHKRNKRNNFIAIEAKKTSNINLASKAYDLLKLQALIQDERYNYKNGYFIDLPVLSSYDGFSGFSVKSDNLEPRVKLILPK